MLRRRVDGWMDGWMRADDSSLCDARSVQTAQQQQQQQQPAPPILAD